MLFDKPLKQIEKADLDALVADAVREDKHLDYKLEVPLSPKVAEPRRSDAKADLCTDVAAFANAGGGLLVYGVRERRDEGRTTAIAEAMLGLTYNFDELRRSFQSSVDSGLDPKVQGLEFHEVPGFVDGSVFLVRVPRSWRGLHRVVHSGSFPVRGDGMNRYLDTSEIRAGFVAAEAVTEKIRRFRDDRIGRILAGETPVELLPDGVRIAIHMVPLVGLDPQRQLGTEAISHLRYRLIPLGGATPTDLGDRFNLDGYLAFSPSRSPVRYVQLFRSGAIESVNSFMIRPVEGSHPKLAGRMVIRTVYVESTLIETLKNYLARLRELELEPPYSVMLSIVGARGYILDVDLEEALLGATQTPIDRDVVELPDVLVESHDDRADVVLRPVLDALWQAAGQAGCANYDASGRWKAPSAR
jgi:hypothetical protein